MASDRANPEIKLFYTMWIKSLIWLTQDSVGEKLLLQGWVSGITNDEGTKD